MAKFSTLKNNWSDTKQSATYSYTGLILNKQKN